jgi:murein DD-endopeptidase MepM/ murein hydrolase activator NlpD
VGPTAALAHADTADRVALLAQRASRAGDDARDLQVRPAPGKITGPFGERRPHHIHPGVDIDGETGDPVVAALFGTVSYVGPGPKGYTGYGEIVVIDHDGFQTIYAHLSRIDVAAGQTVRAGDAVGAIGRTGIATGSHLHFEVRINNKPVDPASIFRFL